MTPKGHFSYFTTPDGFPYALGVFFIGCREANIIIEDVSKRIIHKKLSYLSFSKA